MLSSRFVFMTLQQRYDFVLHWLSEQEPEPETELHYQNAYQLLVSVILSAQCTDKRVNLVTPDLFKAFPDPETLSRAGFDDVEPLIRSISFANNKSRHIIGMAQMLIEKYGGVVPQTVDELVELPGVGRKTANVITSVIWAQPNMAVDTHVFRVAARLGLTKDARSPEAAERQLLKHIPTERVHRAHHWLILHGRYVCLARKPLCEKCGLHEACRFFQKEMKYVLEGSRKYDPEKDLENKLGAGSTAARKTIRKAKA